MKNTLFKKYLATNLLMVVLSFFILGIMLITSITNYWEEEKKDLLTKNALNITYMVQKNSGSLNGKMYVDASLIKGILAVFSKNIDADIIVANEEGEIIISSFDNENLVKNKFLPFQLMQEALNGTYSGINNFGGIYKYGCYGVGVPLTAEPENKTKIGAVFTITDTERIENFRLRSFKTFSFAILIAFLISLFSTGLISYKMTKPLKEMSIAARQFGGGNFKKRVPITSNDEIGQLAVAFNNMANSLSLSENVRRSFIANVSHELKTPMTVISGFVDGILDGTIENKMQNHYLKIVSGEIKRLSRLVTSMLELSRIEKEEIKFNKKPFNINKVLYKVISSFQKEIIKKEIKIEDVNQKEKLFINANEDAIHQVIYNLVENAVKFTEKNGFIHFRIQNASDRINFCIRNTGKGVSESEINLIFDKFYKTDSSRSIDKNGVGLGLYIVKTIIRLHGGDILAKSEEGKYCEFNFWIPKKYNTREKI
ncbi:MAG: HAMP domain-containing histidine kinase [Oscillospiraceae bacterium]|jgi:signal transduction histidine kinase|nr:HAMP domain-containing histidine kinase [Oscillospiraceae bacterium]